jgi:hypothetical protein
MFNLREATGLRADRKVSLSWRVFRACRVSPGASLMLSGADGPVSQMVIFQRLHASCGSTPALRPVVPSDKLEPRFPWMFRIGWAGHFGLRFDTDLRHLGE